MTRPGSLRGAIAVAAGSYSLFAMTTFAQQTAAAPGEAEAERVIVTGSIIPTAEEVGPNPLHILNRDLIDKSAERTTAELLKAQPIANANSVPVQNNNLGAAGPTSAA